MTGGCQGRGEMEVTRNWKLTERRKLNDDQLVAISEINMTHDHDKITFILHNFTNLFSDFTLLSITLLNPLKKGLSDY